MYRTVSQRTTIDSAGVRMNFSLNRVTVESRVPASSGRSATAAVPGVALEVDEHPAASAAAVPIATLDGAKSSVIESKPARALTHFGTVMARRG